ncbi:Zinc finger BED domain-containing protein 4 [Anabarilius grahami]|uniref:Zinc finger BED domain-containing protein 4 n=1 Tax=Anabarilius grahami TaxID=495550 RepID=A0A3N0YN30_ANAGA|nr:Zinc finger BED domain-containing protein 4 [Anabarilius grahami]
MITHLKSRHPEQHQEFLKSKKEKMPAKTHQQPLLQSFDKARKYSSDHPKVKDLNDKIIEFIALDNQPFSVVEDVGFRRLMMHLEPRYAMPSRRYFSDVALPELQSVVASQIEKLLAGACHISFTTDIWTSSVSPVSMLSLTAQWIDEDFTLKKAVLHSQECSGSHTAAAIASAFESMFGKWKIERERVHVVLRDNARNMAKAMMEFGVTSLPCMAHSLQLAVNDGVLSQRSVADVVAVGRRIIGHFKHSQLAYSRLADVQKELGIARDLLLKVLDDMSGIADASTEDPLEKRTRTGSLLDMYDEILEENVMFEEQDKTASASQVISYLAEPTIPRNHSPLEYWKCNQARFPALALAARKYLCAPCTSVDSERLFSVASDVMDEKRNRMDGEKAEMLIFLKKNLPLVLKK